MIAAAEPTTVLLLPGWQNSGEGPWQTRWEARHGDVRVDQHEWLRPLRGDWCARLEEVVVATPRPVALVAHSLGCLLVAAWAAHSRRTDQVRAALLVAPADLEREDLRQMIPGWSPVVRERLPFRARVVAASNDPYCSPARAHEFARAWGADLVPAGARGHLNAESGLGDWPEGRHFLNELLNDE